MEPRQAHSPILLSMLLAAVLVAAAASRVIALNADPPSWMEPTYIMDEGDWADPARGQVLFGSYFSDDLGTGFFMAPLYTWSLEAIYRIAGVGRTQTRALAAIGTMLALLIVVWFAWKSSGQMAAVIAGLLLAASPFYWAYSRVAFIEGFQTFPVILSFALWFAYERSLVAALLAGLAAGAAVIVKPSALYTSLFPIAISGIALWMLKRKAEDHISFAVVARRAGAFIVGGMIAAIPFLMFVVVPYWERYWTMLYYESGGDRVPLKIILTLPGSIMMSRQAGQAVFWRPILLSPVIALSSWLILFYLINSRNKITRLLKLMPRPELAAICFALSQTLLLLLRSWKWNADHYFVVVAPSWALVGGFLLRRILSATQDATEPTRRNYLYRVAFWLILTLPIYLILKPPASNLIRQMLSHISVGLDRGVSVYTTATLFTGLWIVGLLLQAWLWRKPAWLPLYKGRRFLPSLFLILIAGEFAVQALNLATPKHTFAEAQQTILKKVAPGETILGSGSSSIFSPVEVKTCRRVENNHREGFAHPTPNEDVWQRLRPRYILEQLRFNYNKLTLVYDDVRRNYTSTARIQIGPWRDGTPKYEYELFEISN